MAESSALSRERPETAGALAPEIRFSGQVKGSGAWRQGRGRRAGGREQRGEPRAARGGGRAGA